jgi:hypothetical protein
MEITDYPSLIRAMRRRCDELQISRERLDGIAGVANRLSSKLLGNPVKRLCLATLGPMLAALGVKLVLIEDS